MKKIGIITGVGNLKRGNTMNGNKINKRFGDLLDQIIREYITDFKKEHTELELSSEDVELMGAYMYTKGIRDGVSMLNYLDTGYINEEILARDDSIN